MFMWHSCRHAKAASCIERLVAAAASMDVNDPSKGGFLSAITVSASTYCMISPHCGLNKHDARGGNMHTGTITVGARDRVVCRFFALVGWIVNVDFLFLIVPVCGFWGKLEGPVLLKGCGVCNIVCVANAQLAERFSRKPILGTEIVG